MAAVRQLLALSGLSRHKALLAPIRSDEDVLRATYRFLRDDGADAGLAGAPGSDPNPNPNPQPQPQLPWEVRLARRYYAKLFREFALADLSKAASEGQVGLRWRTEAEVVSGTGQFTCGCRRTPGGGRCAATAGLASFELLFAYVEAGASKAALVKVRACPECAQLMRRARPGGGGGGGGDPEEEEEEDLQDDGGGGAGGRRRKSGRRRRREGAEEGGGHGQSKRGREPERWGCRVMIRLDRSPVVMLA